MSKKHKDINQKYLLERINAILEKQQRGKPKPKKPLLTEQIYQDEDEWVQIMGPEDPDTPAATEDDSLELDYFEGEEAPEPSPWSLPIMIEQRRAN